MSDDEFDFRAWRERMGMTRAEVAEALDVSASWVQSVDLGRRAPNGRLLELACRYIEGHHRAVATMEDEPDPAPALDASGIMDRLDGIARQVDALGVLVRRLVPLGPGAPPGMEAPPRPRYVMPPPTTTEELERSTARAKRVREMQEAEAAREAEEGA